MWVRPQISVLHPVSVDNSSYLNTFFPILCLLQIHFIRFWQANAFGRWVTPMDHPLAGNHPYVYRIAIYSQRKSRRVPSGCCYGWKERMRNVYRSIPSSFPNHWVIFYGRCELLCNCLTYKRGRCFHARSSFTLDLTNRQLCWAACKTANQAIQNIPDHRGTGWQPREALQGLHLNPLPNYVCYPCSLLNHRL